MNDMTVTFEIWEGAILPPYTMDMLEHMHAIPRCYIGKDGKIRKIITFDLKIERMKNNKKEYI